jgi:hypothetical protein
LWISLAGRLIAALLSASSRRSLAYLDVFNERYEPVGTEDKKAVHASDLHPIGLRQTAVTLAPDYIECEFQHWHLLPLGTGLEAIPLADAEVSGLVDVSIEDAIALAEGGTGSIPARYATRLGDGLEYAEAALSRADLGAQLPQTRPSLPSSVHRRAAVLRRRASTRVLVARRGL